jgi:hypothetical protein
LSFQCDSELTIGRSTQEAPIGLAGGLNLYGFAAGDPVNFTNPFGLCADSVRTLEGRCPGGLTVDEWDWVVAATKEMKDATKAEITKYVV